MDQKKMKDLRRFDEATDIAHLPDVRPAGASKDRPPESRKRAVTESSIR
jgi:hypothetical protein